jgi:hypothetical protein
VAPQLAPYNLGSSDFEAEHCLVLDRQERRAYVAPVKAARAFLQAQHPPEPELSPWEREEMRRDLEEALARGWQEVRVDPQEVSRQMEEQRRAFAAMLAFLDQAVPPVGRSRGHRGA